MNVWPKQSAYGACQSDVNAVLAATDASSLIASVNKGNAAGKCGCNGVLCRMLRWAPAAAGVIKCAFPIPPRRPNTSCYACIKPTRCWCESTNTTWPHANREGYVLSCTLITCVKRAEGVVCFQSCWLVNSDIDTCRCIKDFQWCWMWLRPAGKPERKNSDTRVTVCKLFFNYCRSCGVNVHDHHNHLFRVWPCS